jgi:hypothetical protein
MKSITIHDLDDQLAHVLEARAKQEHLSLNKTVKKLLTEALGLRPYEKVPEESFGEFTGVWTAEERAEFDKTAAEHRRIDEEQWRA